MNQLSHDFLNELFRLVFLKNDIYEIVKTYVKYEYIPSELRSYKKILKSVINTTTNSIPSFGVVSQQHIEDVDVQEALNSISSASVVDKVEIVTQLESFIKNQRFKILNQRIVDLYSDAKDNRRDEAMRLSAEESQEIVNFSLRSERGGFLKLFGDFNSQMKDRRENLESVEEHEKIPFGIDKIDDITNGGIDSGDIAMWIMRSGVGKSTTLKWTGMYNCRLGKDVLHIQLEGGKQEAYDKYAQMWTKASYSDVKTGDFTPAEFEKLENYIEKMNSKNRELFIYSFDKFGEASMTDVRELIIDYQKINGKFPDIVIIDSLDLLSTGVNRKIDTDPKYKKEKMDKVAQLMKDVCTEFYPLRILTTTQASDFNGWNDPDQYLTRSNTEGNRTLVKPFSYVMTFNSTREETKNNLGRVFIDKFRNYKLKLDLFKIKTAYDKGAFYDRRQTLEMYKKSESL
jgi:hypothetical protein